MPPPLQDEMELLLAQAGYTGDVTDFQEIAQFVWGFDPVRLRVLGAVDVLTIPHWEQHWASTGSGNDNAIRTRYNYELNVMLGNDVEFVE